MCVLIRPWNSNGCINPGPLEPYMRPKGGKDKHFWHLVHWSWRRRKTLVLLSLLLSTTTKFQVFTEPPAKFSIFFWILGRFTNPFFHLYPLVFNFFFLPFFSISFLFPCPFSYFWWDILRTGLWTKRSLIRDLLTKSLQSLARLCSRSSWI